MGGQRQPTWPENSCRPILAPSTWPFISSQALWAPIQKEGVEATMGTEKGAGRWGLFLGESPEPSWGRLPDVLFVILASGPTQTKQGCDRSFAVISVSLLSA